MNERYKIYKADMIRYSGKVETIEIESDWITIPKKKMEQQLWELTNHNDPDPVTNIKLYTKHLTFDN